MGGAFNKILGTKGLGLTGEDKSGSQTTNLDPQTKALNRFRIDQLYSLGDLNGGLGNVYGDYGQTGQIGNSTQDYINQLSQYAAQSGMQSQDWYNQAYQGLDNSNQRSTLDNIYGGVGNQLNNTYGSNINNIQSALDYGTTSARDYYGAVDQRLQGTYGQNLASQYGQYQQAYGNTQGYYGGVDQALQGMHNWGLQNQYGAYGQARDFTNNYYNFNDQRLAGLNTQTDPTAMVNAGRDYYNQILGPQVGSQYALTGLARSGGRQEAEGKAIAGIALPITQQVSSQNAQMQQLINQIRASNYGQQGQELGNLSQAYNAQLANTNQQFASLRNSNFGQQGSQLGALEQAYMGQLGATNQQFAGLQASNFGQQGSAIGGLNQSYLQDIYGAGQSYQGQEAALGGQYASAYGDLGNQYLQQLYGLNQAYPGIDTALRSANIQNMGAGIQASDYGRLQSQQTQQTQLQAYLSALNATPYQPGGSIDTTGTTNAGLVSSVFGGGGGGTAVGGLAVAGAFS